MAPATFQIALTPAQFDALAIKHLGEGVTFAGSGILPEQRGVQLGYSINRSEASVKITFTVIKKPWIATVGMIENELKKMMGLA